MRLAASVVILGLASLAGTRSSADAPSLVCLSPHHASPRAGRHVKARLPPSVSIVIRAAGLNYTYSPRALTVKSGTDVMWVNRTAEPHTVTENSGTGFDIHIDPHRSVSLRLTRKGRYEYFCRFHPYMQAVIVVTS